MIGLVALIHLQPRVCGGSMNETTNVVQSYFNEHRIQTLVERSRVVDLHTIYG
jgi:hypothetical protein